MRASNRIVPPSDLRPVHGPGVRPEPTLVSKGRIPVGRGDLWQGRATWPFGLIFRDPPSVSASDVRQGTQAKQSGSALGWVRDALQLLQAVRLA